MLNRRVVCVVECTNRPWAHGDQFIFALYWRGNCDDPPKAAQEHLKRLQSKRSRKYWGPLVKFRVRRYR